MSITKEQRQKFKEWSKAVDKLTPEEKRSESVAWIESAFNILENKKEYENKIIKKTQKKG